MAGNGAAPLSKWRGAGGEVVPSFSRHFCRGLHSSMMVYPKSNLYLFGFNKTITFHEVTF